MSTPVIPLYVPPSQPLRTKRNFKSLQLPPLDTPPIPAAGDPVPTRLAPAPGGKKRPPALGDNDAPGAFLPRDDPIIETPISARKSAIAATLSTKIAQLDMQGIRDEDLKKLDELGQGNGGSVLKVEHVTSGLIMAKKMVLIDAKPAVRKQILRELEIMHECKSEYIVSCYGAYLADPHICICMEFMDRGSFDGIYKKVGAIDIEVVSKVALNVLEGLMYLYDVHRIIHRDIKPSNILCNSQGDIKLCDFGVSGELINSIANTFVGTSVYMSPERIQGAEYSVKSDIWSLGISLIELALGRFPFSETIDSDDDSDLSDLDESEEFDDPRSGATEKPNNRTPTHRDLAFGLRSPATPKSSLINMNRANKSATSARSKRQSKGVSLEGGGTTMSIIELMHQIVREPAPRLPEDRFPPEAHEFVDACLLKDPEARKTPKMLLQSKWMDNARESAFDLEKWASSF
ncbi:STE/STE7/MEK1 protein kinase [Crucibulum laeve]|uniref:STE/STE7/MEK1 protein kinase n=1 Tax=Crucibulum laeve TaxID=68775 RepID=A0A5C3LVL9_9AGAR|nr:STE/STE7/MEK1 protein kinase [Crucibulum laeve]